MWSLNLGGKRYVLVRKHLVRLCNVRYEKHTRNAAVVRRYGLRMISLNPAMKAAKPVSLAATLLSLFSGNVSWATFERVAAHRPAASSIAAEPVWVRALNVIARFRICSQLDDSSGDYLLSQPPLRTSSDEEFREART